MSRPSGLGKWCRRLGVTALVLLSAALLCHQVLLPRLVERALIRALGEAGLADASLVVSAVTPRRLVVQDLAVGSQERLRVASIDIAYSPAALLRRRVHRVVLTGARWDLRVGADRLDLAPLVNLRAAGSGAAGPLPLDRLELRDSAIGLQFGEQFFHVPVAATVEPADPAQVRFGLDADLLGVPVRIEGSANIAQAPHERQGRAADLAVKVLSRSARFTADWDQETGALIVRSAPAEPGSAPSPDRPARFDLAGRFGGDTPGASISLYAALGPHATRVGGRMLALERLAASLDCRLNRAQGRIQLDAQADLDGLQLAGWPIARLRMDSALEAAAGQSWRLAVKDLVLVLAETDLALRGEARAVQGLAARLALSGTVGPAGLALSPNGDCELSIRQLDLAGSGPLHLDAVRMSISAPAGSPLLGLSLAPDGWPEFWADARLVAADPVRCVVGGLETVWRQCEAGASVGWSPARPLDVRGELSGSGEIRHPAASLVLRDVEARVPVSLRSPVADAGMFRLGAIEHRQVRFPGLAGRLSWAEHRLALAGEWPILPGEALVFSGQVDTAESTGELNANLSPRPLQGPADLAGLLAIAWPAGSGAPPSVVGTVGLDAAVQWKSGRLEPHLRVSFKDLAVTHRDLEAEATGVSGSVVVDSLSPLTTLPDQRISLDRVRLGPLDIRDGLVVFRAEGGGRLFVERTRWTWGDRGRLFAHGLRFDPNYPQTDVDLFLEDLPLSEWLRLLTSGRVEGEGRLFGRLPIHYRPHARRKLVWDSGFVYARPGTGWLKVRDTEAARQILAQTLVSLPAPQRLAEVRDRLVGALEDLEYSLLTFDLTPVEDDMTLRVEARGRGRQGPNPVEIGSLVLNINGFGEFLNCLLLVKSGWEKGVDERLDRFFGW